MYSQAAVLALKQLQDQLAEARVQTTRLTSEKEVLQNELQQVRASRDEEVAGALEREQTLQGLLSELKAVLNATVEENAKLRAQLQQAEDRQKEAQEELERVAATRREAERSDSELRSALQRAEREATAEASRAEKALRQVAELSRQQEELAASALSLTKQLAAAQDARQLLEADLEQAEASRSTAQAELADRAAAQQEELAHLTHALAVANSKVGRLETSEQQLSDLEQQVRQEQQARTHADIDAHRTRESLRELKAELAKAHAAAAKQAKEIAPFQRQLEQAVASADSERQKQGVLAQALERTDGMLKNVLDLHQRMCQSIVASPAAAAAEAPNAAGPSSSWQGAVNGASDSRLQGGVAHRLASDAPAAAASGQGAAEPAAQLPELPEALRSLRPQPQSPGGSCPTCSQLAPVVVPSHPGPASPLRQPAAAAADRKIPRMLDWPAPTAPHSCGRLSDACGDHGSIAAAMRNRAADAACLSELSRSRAGRSGTSQPKRIGAEPARARERTSSAAARPRLSPRKPAKAGDRRRSPGRRASRSSTATASTFSSRAHAVGKPSTALRSARGGGSTGGGIAAGTLRAAGPVKLGACRGWVSRAEDDAEKQQLKGMVASLESELAALDDRYSTMLEVMQQQQQAQPVKLYGAPSCPGHQHQTLAGPAAAE